MARPFMGGDFRAIRISLPSQADAEKVAGLLGLVDQFAAQRAEGAQEPAEQPREGGTSSSTVEVSEAAHEEPVQPEPVKKPSTRKPKAKNEDYDPIAAVLG